MAIIICAMIRCDDKINRFPSTFNHHPLLLSHLIDLHLRYLLLQNEFDTHQTFLGIEKNGNVNLTFDKILTTLAICNGKEKNHCNHPYVRKFHVNM
jgi:hypothetical protein